MEDVMKAMETLLALLKCVPYFTGKVIVTLFLILMEIGKALLRIGEEIVEEVVEGRRQNDRLREEPDSMRRCFREYFGFDPKLLIGNPVQKDFCVSVYKQKCRDLQDWYAKSKRFFVDPGVIGIFVSSVEHLENMVHVARFFDPEMAEKMPKWNKDN